MTEPAGVLPARGFGWHLGALLVMRVAGVAANAAFYVLAARELGVEIFGRSAALVGIVALLSVVADFGTSSTVTRDAASSADPEALGPALRRRARGGAVSVTAAGAVSAYLAVTGAAASTVVLPVFVAAWVWAVATQTLLAGLLIGRGRTVVGGAVPLIEKLFTVSAFVAMPFLVAAAETSVLRMWSSVAGGVALSTLVTARRERALLRRAWRRRRAVRPPGAARESVGFFASSVGAQLQNLDVPLVGWVAGGSAAGMLAAPSRMTNPLGILASAAASMLLVQDRHGPGGGRWGAHRMGVVTAGVGIVTFVCVSPLVFLPGATAALVLGESYRSAAGVCRLVALAVCVAAVNQPLAADAEARFDQARVGAAVAAGGLTGVLVVLTTAPALGAAGGGWAMIATQLVVLGLLLRARSSRSARRVSGGHPPADLLDPVLESQVRVGEAGGVGTHP